MAKQIVKIESKGLTPFFDAKDHEGDAFFIEIHEFEEDKQFGTSKPKDVITAELVAFDEDGRATDLGRRLITNVALVNHLREYVGYSCIQTLGSYRNNDGNKVWVWNDASAAQTKHVMDYLDGLDAKAAEAPDDFED